MGRTVFIQAATKTPVTASTGQATTMRTPCTLVRVTRRVVEEETLPLVEAGFTVDLLMRGVWLLWYVKVMFPDTMAEQ